jgi:L-threonylcarbamoyladenylate synthase
MIILLDSVDKLTHYVKQVPPIAYDLIANSASPLTIVYSNAKNLPKNLVAKDGSTAIRVVKGRYTAEVIRQLDKPLVSTSANYSGQPTASFFDQIDKGILEAVDYVVEHFRNRTRNIKPSTVIKLEENGQFTIIRP